MANWHRLYNMMLVSSSSRIHLISTYQKGCLEVRAVELGPFALAFEEVVALAYVAAASSFAVVRRVAAAAAFEEVVALAWVAAASSFAVVRRVAAAAAFGVVVALA